MSQSQQIPEESETTSHTYSEPLPPPLVKTLGDLTEKIARLEAKMESLLKEKRLE